MPNLATATWQNMTQVLIWGGVLILAVVVFFTGLWYYRKLLLRDDPDVGGVAWTLDDLHRMRQEGQLTEEEYRALRATMVAAFQGKKADVGQSGGPGGGKDPGVAGEEPDKRGPDFDLRKGPTP